MEESILLPLVECTIFVISTSDARDEILSSLPMGLNVLELFRFEPNPIVDTVIINTPTKKIIFRPNYITFKLP